MTQWFAIELDYPIRVVNKSDAMGEIIIELQNIHKGGVKDDLFMVPSGYEELQMPQTPQMPAENQ